MHQHLQRLVAEGWVRVAEAQKTGGRPVSVYAITDSGSERFPRQYSWFSELLLAALEHELGENGLKRYLDRIASDVAAQHAERFGKLDMREQLDALTTLLNDLGYDAEVRGERSKGKGRQDAEIVAHNCVYHDLARTHPEVCAFDLGLMRRLLGREVEHRECMVRGGQACVFVPGAKRRT